MAENTFLGLQPYTEEDAYRFKGRAEESLELFRLIVRNDFTVCYAESGEGKTSLLNAGVFPLLRENMYFPIAITFTSDDYQVTPDSFDDIIDRCIKDSIADYNEKNTGVNVEYKLCSTDFQGLDCQAALQRELSNYSWWKLRNYRPQAMGLAFIPVFIFDQFEEVFNMPESNVWTKEFFDWLENVSSDSCPEDITQKVRTVIGDKAAFPSIKEEKDFKAVFSLRKEFIGELDYWGMQRGFIPALKDNRYCLKPLTYEGAKKVLTQQPQFDEGKVEQVLNYFLEKYTREPERTKKEKLPAIPALLLSVVGDSWEKDIQVFNASGPTTIDQSLNGILKGFYNEALFSIIKEVSKQDAPNQCLYELESALFSLVDGNGKRIRTKTTTPELTKIDFDKKYKQLLANHRIIKVAKVNNEDYVEIVHDCLCPIISKRKEERMLTEAQEQEHERIRLRTKKRIIKIISYSVIILILSSFGFVAYLYRQNNTLSRIKSLFYAEKAMRLFQDGDTYTGLFLALEAVNSSNTVEAEEALRKCAYYSYITIKGHEGNVNSAEFSPDGKYIVSASEDNTIKIWDTQSFRCVNTLLGHGGQVEHASFSPDGTKIISASRDGSVRIWDVTDITNAICIDTLAEDWIHWMYDATFSHDGSLIATADEGGKILLWQSNPRECIDTLAGHNKAVRSVVFSHDNKRIASYSEDGTLRIWCVSDRICTDSLSTYYPFYSSNKISFSKDDKYILFRPEYHRDIWEWDIEKKEPRDSLQGGKHAYYSEDGDKIIVTDGFSLKELNAADKTILRESSGTYTSINISPDNRLILWTDGTKDFFYVCSYDEFWEKDNKLLLSDDESEFPVFSDDGKEVTLIGYNGNLKTWNFENKEYKDKTEKSGPYLRGRIKAVSPDGRKYAYMEDSIYIYHNGIIHSVSPIPSIEDYDVNVNKVVFSHDGTLLASAANDGTIGIWNYSSPKESPGYIHAHDDWVLSVAISPNNKILASASRDKTVKIWDIKRKVCLFTLTGNKNSITDVAFNPTGSSLVSSCFDGELKIWNIKKGICTKTLYGHSGCPSSVSYSNDGKYIISAAHDGTVKVWDVQSGLCIYNLEVERKFIDKAGFSPNMDIIYLYYSSTLMFYDCPTFQSLQSVKDNALKRLKGYELTPEEKQKYYIE